MTVYAVYEPPAEARDVEARAEGLVFLKEGFSWGALLVPAIWLLYHRLWLEFIVFVVLLALLGWLLGDSAAGKTAFGWVSLAIVVLFAFEANDLRGAALERRGYRVAGLASGPDRDSAELSFFRSWLPAQGKEARRPMAPPRSSPPPESGAKPSGDGEEVIGFFPAP